MRLCLVIYIVITTGLGLTIGDGDVDVKSSFVCFRVVKIGKEINLTIFSLFFITYKVEIASFDGNTIAFIKKRNVDILLIFATNNNDIFQ